MWYLRREYHKEDDRGPFVDEIIIGRAVDADVSLKSIYVSRRHCQINFYRETNKVLLRDLNSSNGVFLNGIRVKPNTLHGAQHGDRIGLGISVSSQNDHYIFLLINTSYSNPVTQELSSTLKPIVISSDSSEDEAVPCKRIKIIEDNNKEDSIKLDPDKASVAPIEENTKNVIKTEVDVNNKPSVSNLDIVEKVNDEQIDLSHCQEIDESNAIEEKINLPMKIEMLEIVENEIKNEHQSDIKTSIPYENDEDVIFISSQLPQDQQNIESLNIKPENFVFDDNDDDIIFIGSQVSPGCNFDNENVKFIPLDNSSNKDPICLSSDEDDDDCLNPWLNKLSQNSLKSPPHEVEDKHTNFEENVDNILPITDITNLEFVHSGEMTVQVSPKLPLPDLIPQVTLFDTNAPSTSKALQTKRKFFKTKLIEPLRQTTREKKSPKSSNQTKISKRLTKLKTDDKTVKINQKSKNSKIKKSPENVVKKAENKEKRREKLKELALDEKNKNKSNSNVKHKPGPKPKVKVTSKNRNDNLIQDMSIKKDKTSTKSAHPSKTTRSKNSKELKNSNSTVNVVKASVVTHPNCPANKRDTFEMKSILKTTPSNKKKNLQVKIKSIPKVRYFEIEPNNKLTSLSLMPSRSQWNKSKKESILFNPNHNFRKGTPLVLNESEINRLIDYFVWMVTNWSANWLLQDRNLDSSFLVGNTLQPISSTYSSSFEYEERFIPFLLLETWAEIKRNFDHREKVWLGNPFIAKIEYIGEVKKFDNSNLSLYELKCAVPVNKNFMIYQMPQTGDIYMMRNVKSVTQRERSAVFCYCRDQWFETFHNSHISKFSVLANAINDAIGILHITLIFSKNVSFFQTNSIIELRILSRAISKLRQCTAVSQIASSKFFPFLLNPLECQYTLPSYVVEDEILKEKRLNRSQIKAVHETCAACLTKEPKICYIKGPPGTGKTSVIVNLVFQLLYGGGRKESDPNCTPRILLCAPSNAAIDNIALQILRLRDTMNTNKVKMVRSGNGTASSTNSILEKVSLKVLTDKHIKVCYDKRLFEYKQKKHELTVELEDLKSKNEDTITIEKELVSVLREEKAFEKQGFPKQEQLDMGKVVLENADVVCTTLNSCFNKEMKYVALNSSNRFTCCIVDEASQCTEPDLLIPLLWEIDTLVLVGDTCQLPATVLSQEALNKGFSQSFFQRAEECYKNVPNSPIRFLNVQYRMNPGIIQWPNKYFYKNTIKNAESVKVNCKSNLKPYLLIYHSFIQNLMTEANDTEISFIMSMVMAIWCIHDTFSIGIITPYKKQCHALAKAFAKQMKNFKDHELSVNTIDGCQGQQFDVVIFSCVRTDGVGFLSNVNRINVALTRAKYACYVVGNFQSLQANKMWCDLVNDSIERNVLKKVEQLLSVEEIVKLLHVDT